MHKLLNEKPYELITTTALGFGLLLYGLFSPPFIFGDGPGYLAMIISLIENRNLVLSEDIKNSVYQQTGALIDGLRLLSVDGLNIPVHFFAYSVVNIPMYRFLQFISIDTLKTFQLTNAVFITLSVYYILFSKLCAVSRWTIVAGFILSTGFYYFNWMGPEIYTASALLVSSIAFLDKKYATATLFAMLGSLQNPSVIFMIPFIIIMQICSAFYVNRTNLLHCKKSWTYIGISCSISLFSLTPYFWSYSQFGVFNPIVGMGFIDYKNINFDRFLSFIFDLNQGLIVGLPMLLCAVPAVCIIRVIRLLRNRSCYLYREDILLLVFILIILPTLAQSNWNPGQVVFLRYAAWAGMLPLVWASVALVNNDNSFIVVGVMPALLMQLFMFSYVGGINSHLSGHHLSFKPWVVALWHKLPHFYNPIPEIFLERLNGAEGKFTFPVILSARTKTKEDFILRVLSHQKDFDRTVRDVCGEGRLRPIDNRPSSKPQLQATEHDLYYMTGRFKCTYLISTKEVYSPESNHLFSEGWSVSESTHRWSNGNLSRLVFIIDDPEKFEGLLKLQVGTLGKQKITISVNDTDIFSEKVESWDQSLDVYFDKKLLINGKNILEFQLPDARLPGNGDLRILALALKSFQLR